MHTKNLPAFLKAPLLLSAILTLASCGGSGSGSQMSYSLGGVAATGAALANAPVFLKDAAGNEPAGQSEASGTAIVTTDSAGNFTFNASKLSGLTSPVLIKVLGKIVLDNGDDAYTVLHSLANIDGSSINVTPLTEVATSLALAKDPAAVFSSPGSTIRGLGASATQTASDALMNKLLQSDPKIASLNVFSGSLDPSPAADLSNASAGKVHDMLLDSVTLVKSGATMSLIDRNGPADNYAAQPAINLSIGSTSLSNANGAMTSVDTSKALDSTKLNAFISRLNAAFAGRTCDFSVAVNDCSAVVTDADIYASNYKHQGMPADIWLKKWVGEALAIEDFSGMEVSLKSAFVGTWPIGGQDVVRVLLKWKSGSDDNFVFRSLLLTELGGKVVAYGNQQNHLVWVKPTLTSNPDADNSYPFYPRFENGLTLIAGHWYAGAKNVVIGARFAGPGLPTNRSTSRNNASGELQNPNGIGSGVEVFDVRGNFGCSNLSLDPSVYVSKNTSSWFSAWANGSAYDGSIRYKSGNQTCDPKFDFLRYHGVTTGATTNMPMAFVDPKRGDSYAVTLYLKKTEVDRLSLALPTGFGTTTVEMPDGSTVAVYTVQTTSKLQADTFQWQAGGYPNSMFAGITDATRSNLPTYSATSDRTIEWSRNFTDVVLGTDINGNNVTSRFVNFNAGIFESSYDQMRSIDSYSGQSSGVLNVHSVEMGKKRYQDLFPTWSTSTRPGLCGSYVLHRGAEVKVYAQYQNAGSSTWIVSTTCPTAARMIFDSSRGTYGSYYDSAAPSVSWNYFVARSRVKTALDRWEFVNATQTSRTITGASLIAKERVGATGLCSAQKGFWSYRHAMVQLIDINGRGIMEKRQVWSDFPNKVATLTATDGTIYTRSSDVSRPNMATDDVYLTPLYLSSAAPAADLSVYGFTRYLGEKGFIVPNQQMNSSGQCEPISWQTGQ